MQKIVPHLWFDDKAKEAAEMYTEVFGRGSKVTGVSTIKDTPSGDADLVSFELWGYKLMGISGGPAFKPTPAISLMVNFDPSQDEDAKKRIDEIWEKLVDGGEVRMPLDKYPFSERYGWVADKYGVNWQLILTNPEGEERPLLLPSLLFVGEKYGKAEEAREFYLSVFGKSPSDDSGQTKPGALVRYEQDMGPNKKGTVMFSDFKLLGSWMTAMDGGGEHEFDFNEAVSLMINCKDQEEIDYYWEKLSAVPEAEQCGWLKDKYGVSWQVIPEEMDRMLGEGSEEQVKRVVEAFMPMKKLDLAKLKKAYAGKE